jgi:hypothetical protein
MALSAGRVRRPLPLGLRGMAIGQDQMLVRQSWQLDKKLASGV